MAVDASELEATAHKMVDDGRGLLAADESTGTITSRFEDLGIESTRRPGAPSATSWSPPRGSSNGSAA